MTEFVIYGIIRLVRLDVTSMWTPLQYVCATGNSYRTKEIVKKHPNLLEARGEAISSQNGMSM